MLDNGGRLWGFINVLTKAMTRDKITEKTVKNRQVSMLVWGI